MMDSPVADAPMFPLDDTKVPQPSMEPQSSLFGPDESASAPMDGGIDWGILGDGASGLQDFSDENMEIKSHPASRLDEMDASMGTVNEWQIPSEMPPFSIIQETLTDEEKKEIFTGIGITDVPHIALEAQASSMSKIEEETDKLRDVLEAGDYSSAIELYTRILADYPGNIDLRAELAELYYNFALMDEAAEQFTLLIEKDPQRLDYHQKLSNLHLMNQNIDGAIPEILFIAQAYLERKEYALSLEYLQAILALDSSNIEAREALVDIYVEQKSDRIAIYHLNILANVAIQKSEREKAVALLKKIFNLTGDIDVQLKLAQTLEEYEYPDDAVNEYISLTGKFRDGGDDDNACQCLERIVRIQKENLDAHYQLIDIYGRLGDMEKALEAKHELSGILLSIGEKERALEVLEEILRARPDHHDARHTLIDIYLEKEMVEKALVEAQVLADVYFKEKKVDSAIELYQKLVNADPQNLTLRERLAHFYMMSDRTDSALKEVITIASSLSTRGSWDEAIKTYKKALQIDDRNADIRYQLGLILLDKKGNTRDALMEFQKVFEIDSGHKENTKKYITVLLTEGRPEEAMKVLDKLISLDASNAVLKDEIISSYKKKVEENDDDVQSRYFLGIIYKELKMLDDAIEQFQKTKRINEYFMPSSNMLAMCFALKPGMQQIAVRTLKKALETKEFDEESKLELRYSLAGLMEGSSNPQEALNCYQEIFKTDITYRDVAQKIKLLKDQVGGGGTPGGAKITRLIPREPGGFGD
jgi:tetratricopeptide (TPR) repeat protein